MVLGFVGPPPKYDATFRLLVAQPAEPRASAAVTAMQARRSTTSIRAMDSPFRTLTDRHTNSIERERSERQPAVRTPHFFGDSVLTSNT